MPALYLFGKRTLLAGDDLHFPALVTFLVRCSQLSFFVIPLGVLLWKQASILDHAAASSGGDDGGGNSNSDNNNSLDWPLGRYLLDWWGELEVIASKNQDYSGPPECVASVFARYYPLLSVLHLVGTILFCCHSLGLEYQIWYWSCQGTPTIRQPRTKKVQELLEKKLGTCTIFLGLMVWSTYFLAAFFFAQPYHSCFDAILNIQNINDDDEAVYDATGVDYWVGSRTWYALGALLAISQTAECVVAILFTARLKATALESPHLISDANASTTPAHLGMVQHHELMEELWADRCQSMCRCLSISTCFLFGGRDLLDNARSNNPYQHVAQALADYMETKGTLDVVPTDLFTGLFVLQRIQRQRILQTRKSVFEESSSLLASTVGLSDRTPTTRLNDSMDDHYHPIASPDVKTGLRSRVASINDLREKGVAVSNNQSSLPVLEKKLTPTQSSLQPQLQPPSQHLQQKQGLRLEQYQRKIYRRSVPTSDDMDLLLPANSTISDGSFYRATSRQVLNPCDPTDASTLEEGAQMCKYALSIYTWMLYVFSNPITGFPRLMCSCGTEEGVADCCKSCCCAICGILNDRSNNSNRSRNSNTSSPSQTPLHRHRQSPPANGQHYNTNQQRQPLFSGTAVPSSNPPPRLGMETSRYSSEGSDDVDLNAQYTPKTSGDTFCEWHKRALLLVAGIPEADLVYAEFNNKLSSVPYCILLDHERSVVVVSIRGSLSLEDIVTDALVLPESLEEVGNKYGFDGRGQYCHAGVLACFENVLRDIQKHGLLERLLEHEHPDYSLRIVGHSLGAGVSTLLGYVLRSRYPSLKVFGFSPPGMTMTWDMATRCHAFATSFVLDSDIVPRLSVLALEDLRDEVLQLIGRIKVPKHEVYQNFFKAKENQSNNTCLFGGSSNSSEDDYNYDGDLEELTQIINETLDEVPPDTIYQRQLQDFLRVQQERKVTRGETNSKSLRLYPPGKMIHLIRTGEEGGCSHLVNQCLTCFTSNSGFLYTPVYISNDDLDEIVVSATMGTDHFIDRMCDELHNLSNRFSMEMGNYCDNRDCVAAAYPCGPVSSEHGIV